MTHFGRTHFGRLMRALIGALVGGLLASPTVAHAQQRPVQPKTIPESVNFIWKDLEQDFSSLAEAMPEDKWTFKPTQGEFNGVRTFGEQVKHVACANQAWAKQIVGGKPGPCAEARYCPPVVCCPHSLLPAPFVVPSRVWVIFRNDAEEVLMSEEGGGFGWFLAGLGLGALIGVLYAPKSGRETREDILRSAEEGREYVINRARQARVQADQWVDRGRDVLQKQKDQFTAAVEAGRQAYHEATEAGTKNP